jgi:hypothetical protein
MRLSNAYFSILLSRHSYRKFNNIRIPGVAHNPKVAGSNPAPATKESTAYGSLVALTDSHKLPIRKITVQALAFIGLSTISTTFPFASLFDDDMACP